MAKESIIIRFEQSGEQTNGAIKKVLGLVNARHIIPIIDHLNLEANPRSSKTGPVTKAIQDTILNSPMLFPFKSKGILLAASQYEELDRNRYKITPQNRDIEGILDGGHNTLAIGLHILKAVGTYKDEDIVRSGSINWDLFKTIWDENRDKLEEYLEAIRNGEIESGINFYIPVELLLPEDTEDTSCVESFKNDLLEICEARNNNAELNIAAKAHQKGYFETLESLMKEINPQLASRIEWKTNEGGEIKVQDLIAIAWIPLSKVTDIKDDKGKLIEPPAPNKIYSSKGSCLQQFERLMSSPDVTNSTSNDYRRELSNTEVISAFKIGVQLPELYDYIYEAFPEYYNKADGSYGRIAAVKALNKRLKVKKSPFMDKDVQTMSPDGFIVPLVYGLQALMECKEENGFKRVGWIEGVDPKKFLEEHLEEIVKRYKGEFQARGWDPQKIGKDVSCYHRSIELFTMALHGLL